MGLKNLRKNGKTPEDAAPALPEGSTAAVPAPPRAPAAVPVSHLVPVSQDRQFKVFFDAADSSDIDRVRRSISPFVRLASYVEILEWIYFQAKEHPELIKDFHANYGVALGYPVYSSSLKASCLTDGRILDWICEVTNEKAYKGPTYLVRWMIERWDVICKITGWKPLNVQPEMDAGGDGGFRARAARR